VSSNLSHTDSKKILSSLISNLLNLKMTILTLVIVQVYIYCSFRHVPYFCSHGEGPGLIPGKAGPCGICGRLNDTGTRLSPSTSFFRCQCHSTVASYSYFIPPTPTLHTLIFTIYIVIKNSLLSLCLSFPKFMDTFSFYRFKLQRPSLFYLLDGLLNGRA
jgi:hypothetical protein